jgi:hypothetical protein
MIILPADRSAVEPAQTHVRRIGSKQIWLPMEKVRNPPSGTRMIKGVMATQPDAGDGG